MNTYQIGERYKVTKSLDNACPSKDSIIKIIDIDYKGIRYKLISGVPGPNNTYRFVNWSELAENLELQNNLELCEIY